MFGWEEWVSSYNDDVQREEGVVKKRDDLKESVSFKKRVKTRGTVVLRNLRNRWSTGVSERSGRETSGDMSPKDRVVGPS